MDSIKDIKRYFFKGKANTLEYLEGKLKNAKILPQINFTIEDWHNKKNILINNILQKDWGSIVVRSSGQNEDGFEKSLAGKYKSVINVPNNKNDILRAVKTVIRSFSKKEMFKDKVDKNNKILIQPFLKNTLMHGVAFSCDLKNASPYFVINFDRNNETEGITSGKSRTQQVAYISRYQTSKTIIPIELVRIKKLLIELENISGCLIDIEFGIQDNCIYLFQVRPLIVSNYDNYILENNIKSELRNNKLLINKLKKTKKSVFGNTNLFSDMTDWNPAEIIGIYPKQLSISLYKYLITDKIWATSRKKIGYKDISSEKLMFTIAGHPFINIRNSFNSLLPADLSKTLSNKLINYYLKKLKNYPFLHDKVEFSILHSCYSVKTEEDLEDLKKNGFSQKDINTIVASLKKLTKNIFTNPKLSIHQNLSEVSVLEKKYKSIIENPLNYDLKSILQICIKFGTFPFAILARYAFIVTKIIRDLEQKGLISKQNTRNFFNNIETIATKSTCMYSEVLEGNISLIDFLKEFGHLRPGTYDPLQYRYDQKPDIYFNNISLNKNKKNINSIKAIKSYSECFTKSELKSIQNFTNLISEDLTCDLFLDFAADAIKSREYAKFQFSKVISNLHERLKEFGKREKISPEDLVYLKIEDILNHKKTNNNNLIDIIKKEKKKYELYKQIKIPGFIEKSNDIEFFRIFYDKPNYISNKIVTGQCVYLKKKEKNINLDNKIIIVENADPGFDWLFTHNIKGLITKYGGAASHMAIRCIEFNLPAAIGCGELIFENLNNKKIITIDCENETIIGN